MLKDTNQMTMDLSPYQGLYEAIIPQDHILRKLKDNIDFSFVNLCCANSIAQSFGRPAKEPEMMFKLLFLKKLYDLSDEQLISRAQTDMAHKYFLWPFTGRQDDWPKPADEIQKTRITENILEDMLKDDSAGKGLVNRVRRMNQNAPHEYDCLRKFPRNHPLRRLSEEIYIPQWIT